MVEFFGLTATRLESEGFTNSSAEYWCQSAFIKEQYLYFITPVVNEERMRPSHIVETYNV